MSTAPEGASTLDMTHDNKNLPSLPLVTAFFHQSFHASSTVALLFFPRNAHKKEFWTHQVETGTQNIRQIMIRGDHNNNKWNA
jgi:hypothetical protein